ncbi:MAG: acyltransferase family protein [Prosthecobacter sp.]
MDANAPTPPPVAPKRLMSVDALRGFDMLWIVGAGAIVTALEQMSANPLTELLSTQLKHVEWEGFRFYDLIFPLFLFIVGVSLVFSLDKALARGGRAQVLGRVFRRGLLLFAAGVFYYGGLSKPWPEVQLGGVLHRIAACYVCAALIYTFVRSPRGLVAVCVVLLVGFWALVTFVPVPDFKLEPPVVEEIARRIGSDSPSDIAASVPGRVTGSYEEGRNLVNHLDFLYLPGKKAQRYYINEGLLSTLPAIALSLFGVLTGLLFKNASVEPRKKIAWLVGAGIGCIALGLLWSVSFPLIKRIWTSSFIIVAGGCSALLMALFYWLVDVRQWRGWCRPFMWVGCNALTIYLTQAIVGFQTLATRFTGGDVRQFFDHHVTQGFGGLVTACTGLLLVILFARFLYRRQIFLRV